MQIRNIAIIAHVDHGKTTLVDGMLKQTHTFRDNQAEMTQTTILDSNELERERGITILAKNTAVFYKDYKINIIDTPGHADFSGEVERVINMADGALLIVDAAEGPLPQTRFVLEKALDQGLKVIVVINKIDRKDADIERVKTQVEDLFLLLARRDEDLMFPVVYAVAREEKAWDELPSSPEAAGTLAPLFEKIIAEIPAPKADTTKTFKMLVTNIDFDAFKGVYAIGKVLTKSPS
jgi:GTP-binding protein